MAILPLLLIAIKFDTIEKIAKDLGEIDELMHQTNQIFSQISQQSQVTALTQKKVDFSQLPNLTERGPFLWKEERLLLNEPNHRSNKFITKLYLPNVKHPAPVIYLHVTQGGVSLG